MRWRLEAHDEEDKTVLYARKDNKNRERTSKPQHIADFS
jgi:hypothetical protein